MNTTNEFHPIKAVAIDLDGTLLGPELTISSENHAAIEELHDSGVRIILASGRHHISMLPYAKLLPQVEWMVSAQGAFAANLDLTTVLYDNHLPTDRAAQMIDAGLTNKYSVIVYAKGGIYALNQGEWIDYYTRLAGIVPTQVSKDTVLKESIFKVVLLDTEERIQATYDLPEVANWDFYKVRSLKNIHEFAGLGTSKARALAPLLSHLGIDPSELATFGDAPNDIPMFEFSGYSVAMRHGWNEAKDAAKTISPPGEPETAFARAIQQMKLSGYQLA